VSRLPGRKRKQSDCLAEQHRGYGARPEATALGSGFRTAAPCAAALNGVAMHVLDFEPMWSPANHGVSTTLPGAGASPRRWPLRRSNTSRIGTTGAILGTGQTLPISARIWAAASRRRLPPPRRPRARAAVRPAAATPAAVAGVVGAAARIGNAAGATPDARAAFGTGIRRRRTNSEIASSACDTAEGGLRPSPRVRSDRRQSLVARPLTRYRSAQPAWGHP
jgi:hypothetical protein